jgi:AraC-like DNA-binding protein
VLGVHFKPGGAFPFVRASAGELHNGHVPLPDLWGRTAHELREQILEAGSTADRFRLLEQALLSHVQRRLARHPAVALALHIFENDCAHLVDDVVRRVGLSPRRFIQVFTDEVGLTPKMYCRVRRFQEVLRRINLGCFKNGSDIALSCGYYDQAHCIRDFRAFSGLTPSVYLQCRGAFLNHVPISD